MAQYQEHGFVVGTISISRGDTPRDEDRFPDIVAATTEVYFDRMKGQEVQSNPARIVSYERMVAKILPSGELTGDLDEADNLRMDPQGQIISKPGIWLTVGQYEISFSSGGLVPPANPLLVTTSHTEDAPVDIVSAYNEAPPPSAPVKLVSLPMARSSNVIMGWDATTAQPTWFEPEEVIEVDPTVALDYTDVEVAKSLTKAKGYTDVEVDKGVSRANSYTEAQVEDVATQAIAHTDGEVALALAQGKEYTDTEVAEGVSAAKDYADLRASGAITTATDHADTKADAARQAAEGYARAEDVKTLGSAKGYTDDEVSTALTQAQEYADDQADAAKDAANQYTFTRTSEGLTSARSYTDTKVGAGLVSAKSYTDTEVADVLSQAKSHANTGDAQTLGQAKTYADDQAAEALTAASNHTSAEIAGITAEDVGAQPRGDYQAAGDYATSDELTQGLAAANTHADQSSTEALGLAKAYTDAEVAGVTPVSIGAQPAGDYQEAGDYASAAQGAKADSAVQPAVLSSELDRKADLIGGVIPTNQIPAIAVTSTHVVDSEAEMLALPNVQVGDLAVRTDGIGTFVVSGEDTSVLAGWTLLNAPTDEVVSVNGEVGTVVLDAAAVDALPSGWRPVVSDVGGLQTLLDNKQPKGAYATAAQGAKADTAVQPADLPSVSTAGLTGSYTDLINTPDIPTLPGDIGAQPAGNYQPAGSYATAAQGTKADSAVQPTDLPQVARTGSYNDLLNKPSIPTNPGDIGAQPAGSYASAAQGSRADSAVQPADLPDLAEVATTGAYGDLTGKPAIPTKPSDINAQPAGSYQPKGSYASSAQGSKADSAVQPSDLAAVATTGSYSSLSNKPSIPTAPGDIGAQPAGNYQPKGSYATSSQGAKADSAVQPGDLHDVATTGIYTSLKGRPSLAAVATGGNLDVSKITGKITADMTSLAAGDNQLADPYFLEDTLRDARSTRSTVSGGWSSNTTVHSNFHSVSSAGGLFYFVNAPGPYLSSRENYIPVDEGQRWKFRLRVNSSAVRLRARYYFRDGSTSFDTDYSGYINPGTGIVFTDRDFIIPPDVIGVIPAAQFNDTGYVHSGSGFYRMFDPELVSDRGIPQDKLMPSDPGNFIGNPNFENDGYGWSLTSGNSIVRGLGMDGANGLRIESGSGQSGSYYGSADVKRLVTRVQPGQTIRVSAWAKGEGTSLPANRVRLFVRFYVQSANTWESIENISNDAIASDTWGEVSGVLKVPDGAAFACLGLYRQTTHGDITFSHPTIVRVQDRLESPGPVVINGSEVRSDTLYGDTTSRVGNNLAVDTTGRIQRISSLTVDKMGIEDLDDWQSIKAVRPVKYHDRRNLERLADAIESGDPEMMAAVEPLTPSIGLLAEQNEEVGSGLATYDADGSLTGVAYNSVGVAVLPWLHESDDRHDASEALIQDLLARVKALEAEKGKG